MSWLIYRHKCLVTNKSYIGQTKFSMEYRWNGHCYGAKKGITYTFYDALRKHGFDCWEHEVLEDNIQTIEEANTAEIFWIDFYDSMKNGYNDTTGGAQFEMSEESRKRLSNSHKGKKMSTEARQHMSEAQKIFQNRPDIKQKASERSKGRKASDAARQKMSQNNCMHRQEILDKFRGKNSPRAKAVQQIDINTGKIIAIFDTINEAAQSQKVDRAFIRLCCQGKRKSVRGFIWKFNDEK